MAKIWFKDILLAIVFIFEVKLTIYISKGYQIGPVKKSLILKECSEMAKIWFIDILLPIVFIVAVKKNFLYLQRLSDRLCEKPVENCKIVSNLIFPIIVFIFFIYWCSSDNSFNIYSDILFNNILCGYRTALCVRLIKKIPWSLSRVSIRDRTRSTMAVYK